MKLNALTTILAVIPLLLLSACATPISTTDSPSAVLRFSDGRESLNDLVKINEALGTVGVHLSRIEIPKRRVL